MSKIEVSTKRKYIVIGKDAVAQRRGSVLQAAQEFLAGAEGPVKQADVYRAVLQKCGLEDKPTVWNDLALALGTIAQKSKGDKKRATYSMKA